MMRCRLLISFLFVAFAFQISSAQNFFNKNPTKYHRLTKSQIKNLSTVELSKGTKIFPESYLYGMKGDSLILLTDISKWNENSIFAKSNISVSNYDELILTSKAERRQKSALWGAILGGLSYALVQKATATKSYERTISKILTGQQSNNGQLEGVIAGVTGMGLGMIIGQTLAKRKFNLKKQKKASMRKIKEFTYR